MPQKPTTLASHVEVRFMPNIPAIMAPRPAAKLPMDSVSSSRFTYMRTLPLNIPSKPSRPQVVLTLLLLHPLVLLYMVNLLY